MTPESLDLKERASQIFRRYPQERSRSALLPLLHAVQERDGYVTQSGIEEIAQMLGLSTADVTSVASFYTMYYLEPKGEHVISVCHNIACTLMGAERLIASLESAAGVRCGQTTPDGKLTIERAECLAACDLAPMLQVDHDRMIGPLTPADMPALVRSILEGGGFQQQTPPEPPALFDSIAQEPSDGTPEDDDGSEGDH